MLERQILTDKWGVSSNEEDYEIEDSFELGMDQVLEMVQDSKWVRPGESITVPIWIGPAWRYNAAWYVNQSLTNWDFFEERSQEMFFEDSMCENENALQFPQNGKRTEWFAWLEKMAEEMCEKFGIDINYYEIKDPMKLEVEIFWSNENAKCMARVQVDGKWYVDDN